MLLGLDVREDAASNARAQNAGMSLQAPPGHPARGRFFGVAAGLLARRSASYPVFPMRGRISDVKSGTTHCLQLRGQRRILRRQTCDTPASLLATKSCDLVDRDAYMWCYSPASVNGVEKTYARYSRNFHKPAGAGAAGPDSAAAWKRFSPISQDGPLPVTSWHRAQSGIVSRRSAAPGRSGERRAARNPDARRPCSPCRSALHSRP